MGATGKDFDAAAILRAIKRNPAGIPAVIEGMGNAKGARKFVCEKAIRMLGESDPAALYPYFDDLVALMDHGNNFVKWGAIYSVANAATADTKGRFEKIFKRYFAPVTGTVMVAAANVIGGAAKIARAKPALAGRIAAEILKVESAEFEMHGKKSPECNCVACGHAVDFFKEVFDLVGDNRKVRSFIRRQLDSRRPQVRRKAAALVKVHGL